MLIRYLTIKVKKHDLETNYFEKKEILINNEKKKKKKKKRVSVFLKT